MLIYFHGNSEDLGQAYNFIKYVQYSLDMHIIIVEYPGYGVYEGTSNEDNVLNDAHRVMEFILKVLKWKAQDIIVMGRSIGTGPAWYLGSLYQLGALALISPYTSIRGIIQNMPLGGLYKYFVKERFNNSDFMTKVTSPTFILHGKRDELIPSSHGEELATLCKAPMNLIIPTEMTHSRFIYNDDFLHPLESFLTSHKVINTLTSPPQLKKPHTWTKENLNPTELLKSLKRWNYRLECVISEESNCSFDFEDSCNSYDMSGMNYTPPMEVGEFRRRSVVEKISFIDF